MGTLLKAAHRLMITLTFFTELEKENDPKIHTGTQKTPNSQSNPKLNKQCQRYSDI